MSMRICLGEFAKEWRLAMLSTCARDGPPRDG